jgi:hypothetical protein
MNDEPAAAVDPAVTQTGTTATQPAHRAPPDLTSLMYSAYGVITVAGAAAQLLVARKPLTPRRLVDTLLGWSLAVNVGVSGLMGFYGHTARADATAKSIGFPPGNPFQFEVATANLSTGVLGILSIRLRGLFWWATAIGHGVFVFGAAVGHLIQLRKAGNRSPGNIGVVFYWDMVTPLVHLVLLAASTALKGAAAAGQRRWTG